MAIEQLAEPVETSSQSESDMTCQAFCYSPLRYLKTMLAIAWAAVAHPFSTTVIDLSTGEVHHGASDYE